MAIQITLEDGYTEILRGEIRGITDKNDLEVLFDEEAYLDGTFIEIVEVEAAQRITEAVWVDDDPETSFHGFVLDLMNSTDINGIFGIAEGAFDPADKIWEAMENYYHGFQEAVNNLIKSDGLEFVIGNEFNYHSLFNLVVREIVRDYLREHEIADI